MRFVLISLLCLLSFRAYSISEQDIVPEGSFTPSGNPSAPTKNSSFDFDIKNHSNRAVLCRKLSFFAFMDEWSNGCSTPLAFNHKISIPADKDSAGIKLQPLEQKKFLKVGLEELKTRNSQRLADGLKELEYCSRDPWRLECGFSCANGKDFGENWSETFKDAANRVYGTGDYTCSSEGVQVTVEMKCDPKYSYPLNGKCIPLSCTAGGVVRPHESVWGPERIPSGNAKLTCNFGIVEAVKDTVTCDPGFEWSDTDKQCKGKPCGTHPHTDVWYESVSNGWGTVTYQCSLGVVGHSLVCREGTEGPSDGYSCSEKGCWYANVYYAAGRGVAQSIPNGTQQAQCSFGNWIASGGPSCNSGYVPSGSSCVAAPSGPVGGSTCTTGSYKECVGAKYYLVTMHCPSGTSRRQIGTCSGGRPGGEF